MTSTQPTERHRDSQAEAGKARLFFLDASGGRVLSVNPNGSDKKVIATGCRIPDGIDVDAEAGHIYWTNMGVPARNDGSIECVNFDGKNRTTIVPEGGTFTPKQLTLDKANGRINWCDREGMRIMRCNLDGSNVETLVDTSKGDARPGYWTDRGDPPRGNTVNRAPMDGEARKRPVSDIVFDHLMEGIGIALDLEGGRMFLTDLAGFIYSAKLDGSEKKFVLAAQGNLTGIAFATIANTTK